MAQRTTDRENPGTVAHRGDVVASLNYYADPGDGSMPEPVHVQGCDIHLRLSYMSRAILTGVTVGNSGTVTNKRATVAKTVAITDITGMEDIFTLDKNGFQLIRHDFKSRCQEDGYRNKAMVETEYLPVMEKLLKDM